MLATHHRTRMWTIRLIGLMLVSTIPLLAGCGDSRTAPDTIADVSLPANLVRLSHAAPPLSHVHQRIVGTGAQSAVVIWPGALTKPPGNVVVFFHGWGALYSIPSVYRYWLSHLAANGSTIIFPTYLGPRSTPKQVRGNALAGIAAGMRLLDGPPHSVVAAGYTTGGALALDYAATARSAGLPRPVGVFAVFPARNPTSQLIPPADPGQIDPDTEIQIVAGAADPVVNGNAQARQMFSAPTQVPRANRRFILVNASVSALAATAAARRTYWGPLDRLLRKVREQVGG